MRVSLHEGPQENLHVKNDVHVGFKGCILLAFVT